MEGIKKILVLGVFEERITDKFERAFIKCVRGLEGKLESAEGFCVDDEVDPLEERKKILDSEEGKAYKRSLRLLAKLRPEYKKYLPRIKYFGLSNLLKKKIRLAVWVGTGNEIPFQELNVIKVLNLLKSKGYVYRRKSGEMKWSCNSEFVAEDLYGALGHLEKKEAVDRKLLTISF